MIPARTFVANVNCERCFRSSRFVSIRSVSLISFFVSLVKQPIPFIPVLFGFILYRIMFYFVRFGSVQSVYLLFASSGGRQAYVS